MKIYKDIIQGTEEWHELRKGKVTGSVCAVILVGEETELAKGAKTLAYKKASELVTNYSEEFQGNKHTERGNDLEPLAIKAYEEETYNSVERVAFIELNDFVGCSPDGLIEMDGMIEVKCPSDPKYLEYLDNIYCPKAHYAQIQFGLFVTGRKWCDYVVYNPSFGDKPIHVTRIEANEGVIELFGKKVKLFEAEVKRLMELVSSLEPA